MPRLVASDIAGALRKRISSGEWAEIGRMPPERDLASEFGVARNTIRRAVGLLQEDGTVTKLGGRGTFLQSEQKDTLAKAITRIEGTSPADMMEIRLLLEPAAAEFAAVNASIAELNLVRDAHQTAVESSDMPTFEHWDAEFHSRIFACSRNDFLKEIHNIMRILRNQSLWFDMKQRSFSEERRQRYCHEHQAIVDALLIRDREAARKAMHAHLLSVQANLLGK
jgi:DNA-binding FadR family transcriptional regulator